MSCSKKLIHNKTFNTFFKVTNKVRDKEIERAKSPYNFEHTYFDYITYYVANYAGSIDTMHLFVGKTTRNQIVAEYKKKDKEDTQICIGSLSEGKYVFKAGIMPNTAWFLFYTF